MLIRSILILLKSVKAKEDGGGGIPDAICSVRTTFTERPKIATEYPLTILLLFPLTQMLVPYDVKEEGVPISSMVKELLIDGGIRFRTYQDREDLANEVMRIIYHQTKKIEI